MNCIKKYPREQWNVRKALSMVNFHVALPSVHFSERNQKSFFLLLIQFVITYLFIYLLPFGKITIVVYQGKRSSFLVTAKR